MDLIIDLENYKRGDRFKVDLIEEDQEGGSVLQIRNIKIKVFKSYTGLEYIDLEDFLEYVFVSRELKHNLKRFLAIGE